MKKMVSIYTFIIILILGNLVLVGCGINNDLIKLENSLNNADRTYSSLDNISNNDLSTGIFANMYNPDQDSIIPNLLSFDVKSISTGSWIDKFNEAKVLQSQLKEKQEIIDQNKILFKQARADLKTNIKNYLNRDIELTTEEKQLINTYIIEIKEITKAIKETKGMVYLKIFKLREKYNRSNLEKIIATYNDVQPYMDIRVEKSDRLIEIIHEVNNFIVEKVK